MPLYSGTLRELISKGVASNAVLPYFGQILDGVEAAHLLGVRHRDIKPENILFDPDNNALIIADFGIAHFEEEDLLTAVETKNDERLANFLYAAPEQRRRGEAVGEGADIYALGKILNEMFTGTVPDGTGFRKIGDLTPDYAYLDDLVDMMLRQNPSQRPSIGQVKRELIARGNEYLSLQRLNSLRSEVIRETEVDDPIVTNPIEIRGVDLQNGAFTFELSAAPPPNWISAFQSPRAGYSGIFRAGPENFSFNANKAFVGFGPGMDPQLLVDNAKTYVRLANHQYAEDIVAENKKRLAREKEQLRQKISAEESRQRILSKIKL